MERDRTICRMMTTSSSMSGVWWSLHACWSSRAPLQGSHSWSLHTRPTLLLTSRQQSPPLRLLRKPAELLVNILIKYEEPVTVWCSLSEDISYLTLSVNYQQGLVWVCRTSSCLSWPSSRALRTKSSRDGFLLRTIDTVKVRPTIHMKYLHHLPWNVLTLLHLNHHITPRGQDGLTLFVSITSPNLLSTPLLRRPDRGQSDTVKVWRMS